MVVQAGSTGEPPIPLVPLLRVTEQESFDDGEDRRSAFYRQQAWQHAHSGAAASPTAAPAPQVILTVPNILTFVRLALVPVVFVLMHEEWDAAPIWAATLFVAASLTDWLDGYLARKLNFTTAFGAFLDPVADKVMVATALILLTTSPPAPLTDRAMAVPVTLVVCREITMSALREWAATSGGNAHKAVKVNSLGKWKTALQMISMSVLLYARDTLVIPHAFSLVHVSVPQLVAVGYLLLVASTVLAVVSLAAYFANVWTHFVYPQALKSK